jgi:hypothetical protein
MARTMHEKNMNMMFLLAISLLSTSGASNLPGFSLLFAQMHQTPVEFN